jgi:hypothetical protein
MGKSQFGHEVGCAPLRLPEREAGALLGRFDGRFLGRSGPGNFYCPPLFARFRPLNYCFMIFRLLKEEILFEGIR